MFYYRNLLWIILSVVAGALFAFVWGYSLMMCIGSHKCKCHARCADRAEDESNVGGENIAMEEFMNPFHNLNFIGANNLSEPAKEE